MQASGRYAIFYKNEIYNIQYLENEIYSLSGFKILQEMNSIKDSIYVLNSNFDELDNHIKKLKDFSSKTFPSNPNLETKSCLLYTSRCV